MVQWLRGMGCSMDERTCREAAKGGHLEMLQWLRSEGCPWNEYCSSGAALWGHPEVLKWCEENGCPTKDAWRYADFQVRRRRYKIPAD